MNIESSDEPHDDHVTEDDGERRLRWRDVDLRETWQVFAGGILAALGIVLILVGYVGAANSPLVAEQVPYLLSGGLLGLALTVLGGFLFWGHWLYRQYERNEHHQRRQTELLERLAAASWPPSAANGIAPTRPLGAGAGGPELVMTRSGSAVHRRDCAVVQNMGSARTVTAEEVARDNRRACAICNPFDVTAS